MLWKLTDSNTTSFYLIHNFVFFYRRIVKWEILKEITIIYIILWVWRLIIQLLICCTRSLLLFDVLNWIVFAVIVGSAWIIINILDIISWVGKEIIEQSLICIQQIGCCTISIATVSITLIITKNWIGMVSKVKTIFCTILRLNCWFIVIRLTPFCILSKF